MSFGPAVIDFLAFLPAKQLVGRVGFGGWSDHNQRLAASLLSLFPPRFALPVTSQRYSTLAILGIVVLRLAIGWHFVCEGYTKLREKKPFSAAFFGAAKGPAQSYFRGLVWDYDGRVRLDQKKVLAALDQFHERAVSHFELKDDPAKKQYFAKQAKEMLDVRKKGVNDFFAVNGDDIKVYLKGLERRANIEGDPGRMDVESLQGQAQKVSVDLRKDVGPWLGQIDSTFSNLERELNKIGARATKGEVGPLRLQRPDEHFMRAESVDSIIPYFDFTIGLFLILGLFVRPATLLGAIFLGMVVSSQLPGYPGVAPVYYQVVEFAVMIALFATNAGRFAGLDFFLAQLFRRRKRGASA